MGAYIARRLIYMAVTLLVITLITFLIFYVMPPTDPAIAFAGKQPTPEIVAEVKKQFGLDQPIYLQYGRFVRNIFLGDEYGWPGLGFSFDSRSPVRTELAERIGVTLQLASGGAVMWLLMGIPIGIISALKKGSAVDRAGMGFALFGVSAPVFWLALMALFVFWKKLGFAALGTGYIPISESFTGWLGHMILPWTVLAMLYAAFYARMVRGNLIETMGQDYIRTARAKGLSERTVIMKHGLRSSLTPIVTLFGLDFAGLIGGTVITETVFNLRGLGSYVVNSVLGGDLPVVLGITVVVAFSVVLMNLLVDLLYAYLDPRVRLS